MIESARREGLKLCFLWFGLWKNAESFYVPFWMKKDTETYFRTEKVTGEKMNTISPLCAAAVEKEGRDFLDFFIFQDDLLELLLVVDFIRHRIFRRDRPSAQKRRARTNSFYFFMNSAMISLKKYTTNHGFWKGT